MPRTKTEIICWIIFSCFLKLTVTSALVLRTQNVEEEGNADKILKEGNAKLLVKFDGKELLLDKKCSGGVVFRNPVVVDQICTLGSVFVRKSACSSENERIILGSNDGTTCQNVSSPVQSLHYLSVPEGNILASNLSSLTADAPVTDLLQQELLQVVKHNALLKKRQAAAPQNSTANPINSISPINSTDGEQSSTQEGEGAPKKEEETAITTTKSPEVSNAVPEIGIGTDTTLSPEVEAVSDEEDNSGKEPDTFSNEDDTDHNEYASRFPFLKKDMEGRQVPFIPNIKPVKARTQLDNQISSEVDDLGSWENINDNLAAGEYHPLPEPGTLEYAAISGGLDKWFPSRQSSPIFDSHVSLVKALLVSELTGGCVSVENCTTTAQSGGHSSAYNILHKYQPRTQIWYLLLEQMALIVDSIVPPVIIPNRFSSSGENVPLPGEEAIPQFKSQFFHDVLNAFGYQTRSLLDEDVNSGRDGPGYRDYWINDVIGGLERCRTSAASVLQRISLTNRNISNCDNTPELEAIQITKPEWSDTTKKYVLVNSTINYTHHLDPNSFLPPHTARINYRSWIFGELLWYTVQLSYAFCFKEFADSNPNAFMLAYVKILKLFETDVVQDLWASGLPGGNLDIFENMLPFVIHSAYDEEGSLPNGNDFRRMLINLDKISFAIHRESLLDHWMQKPHKRKGGGEKRNKLYEGSRRRKKRDAQDSGVQMQEQPDNVIAAISEGTDPGSSGDFNKVSLISQNNDNEHLSTNERLDKVDAASQDKEAEEEPRKISQSSLATPEPAQIILPTEVAFQNDLQVNTEYPTEYFLQPTTMSAVTGGKTESILRDLLTEQAPSRDLDVMTTINSEASILSTSADTNKATAITSTTPVPSPPPVISTNAHSAPTPPTTTAPVPSDIKEFEIWDSMAYCLISKEGKLDNGDWGDVRPTLKELANDGICSQ